MCGRFILEQFVCNGVAETTGKTETLQQYLFSVRELGITLVMKTLFCQHGSK